MSKKTVHVEALAAINAAATRVRHLNDFGTNERKLDGETKVCIAATAGLIAAAAERMTKCGTVFGVYDNLDTILLEIRELVAVMEGK